MPGPALRHFILCDEIHIRENDKADAIGIFEYFTAGEFPAPGTITAVVGISCLEPGKEYKSQIACRQEQRIIAGFLSSPFSVDKHNEIMNLRLVGEPFVIPEEKPIVFDIYLNEDLISSQTVDVRRG